MPDLDSSFEYPFVQQESVPVSISLPSVFVLIVVVISPQAVVVVLFILISNTFLFIIQF
jgi:hypothetical protein